jgi:hypothetical protein
MRERANCANLQGRFFALRFLRERALCANAQGFVRECSAHVSPRSRQK